MTVYELERIFKFISAGLLVGIVLMSLNFGKVANDGKSCQVNNISKDTQKTLVQMTRAYKSVKEVF